MTRGAATSGSSSDGRVHAFGVKDEVKRIIKACLGVGVVSGMTFEQLVQWLATPQNAAKFVIRRIGLAAAIGCIGGVIFEYT
ncbi:hypothetical protein [Luteococcus sp. OSA5]|uniref:hypothetical protein n=1 Tax=Luteococcus sp. OSA5 TaxID=3401630 RepID=UPI003B427ED6